MTPIKHWQLNDTDYIYTVFSKILNKEVYIFSDSLKDFRGEWLEWFPVDIILLECEFNAIKQANAPAGRIYDIFMEKIKFLKSLI